MMMMMMAVAEDIRGTVVRGKWDVASYPEFPSGHEIRPYPMATTGHVCHPNEGIWDRRYSNPTLRADWNGGSDDFYHFYEGPANVGCDEGWCGILELVRWEYRYRLVRALEFV